MNRNNETEHHARLAIVASSHHHQALVKINRFLLYLVLALTVVVFGFGLWLMPSVDWLESSRPADYTQAYRAQMNPVVASELDSLKSQMVGLISGSMESKLKTLEQSIKLGQKDYTFSTLEDLRHDVVMLKNYSQTGQQIRQTAASEKVLEEVSHLKRLIYWTLASCGLMFGAAAGVWFHQRRKALPALPKRFLGKS